MTKYTLNEFHIPRWNELPTIPLYLDQVVTLINETLSPIISLKSGDAKKDNAILTKTMINNYVKHGLIEAPEKKKYCKTQLSKIFAICILKQVYSMSDIKKLFNIALINLDIEESFNKFCLEFETALSSTFNKDEYIMQTSNGPFDYNYKAVILSCTYKIFVQRIAEKK